MLDFVSPKLVVSYLLPVEYDAFITTAGKCNGIDNGVQRKKEKKRKKRQHLRMLTGNARRSKCIFIS